MQQYGQNAGVQATQRKRGKEKRDADIFIRAFQGKDNA